MLCAAERNGLVVKLRLLQLGNANVTWKGENVKHSLAAIGSNPSGLLGTLAGHVMNVVHGRLYAGIVGRLRAELTSSEGKTSILDVGCGGGCTVRLFCENFDNGKVIGLDHSDEMVEVSRRTNRKYVAEGRAEIVVGDISRLPFKASEFDVVSAFDTINLWADVETSIDEIHRVLVPGGLFVIVNGYPKEGTRWWDIVRFKSDREYAAFLKQRAFVDIRTELINNTIVVLSRKKV